MTNFFEGTPEANLTDRQRLDDLRTRLEGLVRDRMGTLSEEASTIAADLEALGIRLSDSGHLAQIEDIRSARWYRCKDQLLLARTIYGYVCRLVQHPEAAVHSPSDDFSADERSTVGSLDG